MQFYLKLKELNMSYILFTFLLALGHLSNGLPQDKAQQRDPRELLQLTSESRIVGGHDAPDGYAPHMVALLYGSVFTVMLCGGSIVSPRHILTAAHCIDSVIHWQGGLSPSLHGAIGSNLWNDAPTIIYFSNHTNHPLWDPFNVKYDIGVLRTTQAVLMTDRVAPIPVHFGHVGGGVEVSVAGWGRVGLVSYTAPYILQLLYMTTLSPEQCLYDIDEITKVWGLALPLDIKVEICTFHSCGRGMCHGDSGSALILRSTRELIGIVSWGFPCALGAPDMYTRISESDIADFVRILMSESS